MKMIFSQLASLKILILLFIGISQASFAQEENTPQEASSRKIVFLGDSITAGLGLEKSETYPHLISLLAKDQGLEWKCVNAGLSGDTTNGGVRRVKLLVKRPLDLIIVALGGNDGLRGISPDVTQQNLETIIATIKEAQPKAQIILAGIEVPDNMGEDYKQKFLASFTEVAKTKEVTFYPSLIEGISGDPTFNQSDMIHPNEAGQKVIASNLFHIMLPLLK